MRHSNDRRNNFGTLQLIDNENHFDMPNLGGGQGTWNRTVFVLFAR